MLAVRLGTNRPVERPGRPMHDPLLTVDEVTLRQQDRIVADHLRGHRETEAGLILVGRGAVDFGAHLAIPEQAVQRDRRRELRLAVLARQHQQRRAGLAAGACETAPPSAPPRNKPYSAIAAASSVLPFLRGSISSAVRICRRPSRRVRKRLRTIRSCHGRNANGWPANAPFVCVRLLMKRIARGVIGGGSSTRRARRPPR